jgi:NitT/TauT family transport system substrate-binding protein
VKKLLILVLILLLLLVSSGCLAMSEESQASENTESIVLSLANPMGPLVIPLSGFLSGQVQTEPPLEIHYWKTIDEAIGYFSKDEASFVVLPVTVAANLKASGMNLVMLGVHEWKVFYLISSLEATFNNWESLKGETIFTPESKGQTVDTLTRYALERNGLEAEKDVRFVYAPPQEIVALFKEGKVPFAALPEPFVSLALAGGKGKVVLDYQDYWSDQSGTDEGIPIAGLFIKREFYEKHPEAGARIATLLESSIEWMEKNPEEAIKLTTQVISIPEAILQEALPRMKFEFINASECKMVVIGFLTEMQNIYPEGIKAIPADEFFAEP